MKAPPKAGPLSRDCPACPAAAGQWCIRPSEWNAQRIHRGRYTEPEFEIERAALAGGRSPLIVALTDGRTVCPCCAEATA